MTGFEPWASGIGSDRSTERALPVNQSESFVNLTFVYEIDS